MNTLIQTDKLNLHDICQKIEVWLCDNSFSLTPLGLVLGNKDHRALFFLPCQYRLLQIFSTIVINGSDTRNPPGTRFYTTIWRFHSKDDLRIQIPRLSKRPEMSPNVYPAGWGSFPATCSRCWHSLRTWTSQLREARTGGWNDFIPGGGGVLHAIYGLYRHVPLWGVWFSNSLL